MSRYLVSARQGHLEQVFHIFAYLKHHPRSMMVFDDTIPTFKSERFVKYDWSEFILKHPRRYQATSLNHHAARKLWCPASWMPIMPDVGKRDDHIRESSSLSTEHRYSGSRRGRTPFWHQLMAQNYWRCGSPSRWSRACVISCGWWALQSLMNVQFSAIIQLW